MSKTTNKFTPKVRERAVLDDHLSCWAAIVSISKKIGWRSFEGIEYATLEWVDWCNHCRLLEPIDNTYLPKPKNNIMLMRMPSI